MFVACVCKSTLAPFYLSSLWQRTTLLRSNSDRLGVRLQFCETASVIVRKFSSFFPNGFSDIFETQSADLVRQRRVFHVGLGVILSSRRFVTKSSRASYWRLLKKKKKRKYKGSGGKGKQKVAEAKLLAYGLLDYETVPAGSYTVDHFVKSKAVLVLLKLERATDAESVSCAINVLKRFIFELAEKRDEKRFTKNIRWLQKNQETCLNLIFANWKTALYAKEKVMSVDELMQLLAEMNDKVPEFVLPLEVVEMIVEAAIHEAPSIADAAIAAEDIFNYFKRISEPNANIYNLMIVAWGKSGLSGFDKKIQELITRMHALKVQPNRRTFQLLTELWAELGRTSTLEETIVSMQKHASMLPDVFCLWHACRCYARNGLIDKARYSFDQMLKEHDPSKDPHVDVVKNAAIDIITAYHRFAKDEKHFQIERLEALKNAEEFTLKLRESDKIRSDIIGTSCVLDFVFEASYLYMRSHCIILQRGNP
jgi:hypothetical protein